MNPDTHIQRWAIASVAGDRQSFGRLYDYYIREIYRFVYYKTHHREIAEDVTADIFLKAWNRIASFDSDKGTFRTWLYAIARSTVIDHYRTEKSASSIDDAWDLPSDHDMAGVLDTALDISRVEPYLAQLSSEQREIIILRLWEDKSYREIAEILGKSEASCKMAFSRSIKTLREIMPLSLLILFLLHKII